MRKFRTAFENAANNDNVKSSAWSPSGKAKVCKTFIRGFNSRPGLIARVDKKQTALLFIRAKRGGRHPSDRPARQDEKCEAYF
jgi:hypothetical protein